MATTTQDDLLKANVEMRTHALTLIRVYIRDGLARIPASRTRTRIAMDNLMDEAYRVLELIAPESDYWRTRWSYPVGNPSEHVTMALGGTAEMQRRMATIVAIGKEEAR